MKANDADDSCPAKKTPEPDKASYRGYFLLL